MNQLIAQHTAATIAMNAAIDADQTTFDAAIAAVKALRAAINELAPAKDNRSKFSWTN